MSMIKGIGEKKMECISISYKTAGAKSRAGFSFGCKETESFLEQLMAAGTVSQCVLLSTCNRTEVYTQGKDACFGILEEMLAQKAGVETDAVRTLAKRYQGKQAIRHLFLVACGMDSMVIGEDEILGQVRDAYLFASQKGYTGYECNVIFQAALACAKRIKTQTQLSKTSVSYATLAANEVFRLPISPKTVLLIGSSGKMGSTILKNLLSRRDIRVLATTRSHGGQYQDNSGRVKNVDYRERYACLDEADAVISATVSPHYTITAKMAKEAIRTQKKRLFLDVSMPADIDGEIGQMAHCRLIGVDGFRELAQKNNDLKKQAVQDAEEIVREETETLYKVLSFHKTAGKLEGWKERYSGYSFEKLLFLLRDRLDSDSFEAVLQAFDGQEEV